jgi:hypothetical protein
MNINGIYFSEYYWPRYNILWAYRFYPDGALLFTYADPVGRFFLHTEAGPTVCHPNEVLGDKSKLPDFVGCFARELPVRITYRSGLPAVTRGNYVTDGTTVSLTHPYFQFPNHRLAGLILPDRLVLPLLATAGTAIGKKKPKANQEQTFLRLER